MQRWSDHESRITADCRGSAQRGERLIGGPLQIRVNPRFVVVSHRSPGRVARDGPDALNCEWWIDADPLTE